MRQADDLPAGQEVDEVSVGEVADGLAGRFEHVVGLEFAHDGPCSFSKRPVVLRIDVEQKQPVGAQNASNVVEDRARDGIREHMQGHIRHGSIKSWHQQRGAPRTYSPRESPRCPRICLELARSLPTKDQRLQQ